MGLSRSARSEFVYAVTKLSLWYAHLRGAAGERFADALTRRTPVYRLTVFWDGTHHPAKGHRDAEWERILGALEEATDHPARLEAEGVRRLQPVLEPRIDADVRAWPWLPNTYGAAPTGNGEFGFFLYDIRRPASGPPELILHMGNVFAPTSPFAHQPARKRELTALIEDALRREPRIETVRCNSWLNDHPRFLAFFPPSWENEAEVSPVGYSYNWWGQFVDRAGGFHERNGGQFRRTGTWPYRALRRSCPVRELLDELQRRNAP